jgi:lysozyme family protein
MADFIKAISKVLHIEGGYVNDPDDKGGETKYGISKRSYPNEDIKNLTLARAKMLYKRDFWDKVGGDLINDQQIADMLVDAAVNEGVTPALNRAKSIMGEHTLAGTANKLNTLA